MSDLWDYDDCQNEDDFQNWEVAPQAADGDSDGASGSPQTAKGKRKGGRIKGSKASKAAKRGTGPPAGTEDDVHAAQQRAQRRGSDSDDDLLVLTSPPKPKLPAESGPVAGTGKAGAAGLPLPSARSLTAATLSSLAAEREALNILKRVTEQQRQQHDLEEVQVAAPVPSLPQRPHRFGATAPDGRRKAGSPPAGRAPPEPIVLSDEDEDEEERAAPAPSARGTEGAPSATAAEQGSGAAAEGAGPGAQEDRIRLKLVWASGKDGHLVLRVVRTDPVSKMMDKFREVALSRGLSKNPNRIKFLFDGDDLAKTPETTPEDLDLEDDMMIDVKLDKC